MGMSGRPASILFACNHNAVRSPMAEGITKQLFGQQIYVDSVGVYFGEVNGFAISAMRELHIDISGHRPKTFEDLQDTSFDLIIAMTPQAQHAAVELTRTRAIEMEYWATFDPTIARGSREQVLGAFRQARDFLYQRIERRFGSD